MLVDTIKIDVARALSEDIGGGDVNALLVPNTPLQATITAKSPGVLCGQAWVDEAFTQLDPHAQIDWQVAEGQAFEAPTLICTISARSRALLSGERTALNFLQLLSGVATTTRQYVEAVRGTGCEILDTRKTLPNLRAAQKYAVTVGGGVNHRFGLFDAFLLKENHIKAYGSLTGAIEAARLLDPTLRIIVEVETLAEYEEALKARPTRIMLDDFSEADLKEAVTWPRGGVSLEVSGGISSPTEAKRLALLGVDCMSVGALTKVIQPIDFSLKII